MTPANLDDRWLPDALTAAAATPRHRRSSRRLPSEKLPEKAYAIMGIGRRASGPPAHRPMGLDGAHSQRWPGPTRGSPRQSSPAFAKGWPKGKTPKLAAETEKALADLLAKLPAGSKGQLVKLASAWGSTAFDKYAAEITASLARPSWPNEKLADDRRIAAAKQLVEFRSTMRDARRHCSGPDHAAVVAGTRGRVDRCGRRQSLARTWPGDGEALCRPGRPRREPPPSASLLERTRFDAIAARRRSKRARFRSANSPSIRSRRLANHPDRAIAERAKALLAKGGGLPNADRQKVIDELLPLIKQKGDAAHGKLMFNKHCATCHMHSGEGNKIGPDLTGMAVHPKEHLLIHILDPSRSVEGNFRLYTVTLTNGKSSTACSPPRRRPPSN